MMWCVETNNIISCTYTLISVHMDRHLRCWMVIMMALLYGIVLMFY